MKNASPLRYPGGKWRIFSFFEQLIELNDLDGVPYAEPYAGGSSLALSLLFEELVSDIYINDIDPAIYAFWDTVVHRNEEFLDLFDKTPISPEEWKRQKKIYNERPSDKLILGFSSFFLNRTNYSGILNGGMIGGKNQSGRWKLDARFNRDRLRDQIQKIGMYKDRIHVSGEDALVFLAQKKLPADCLTYFDPPYFKKGQRLYHNAYKLSDHARVSNAIFRLESNWIVSYDDTGYIRKLYKNVRSRRLRLMHTARASHAGDEVLFFSPNMLIPRLLT